MLETCQKQHMLLGLSALVAVTIVVLIVESRYADTSRSRRVQNFVIENNSTCWLHEDYTVIQECHPCSDFDIISSSLGVCIHTHYIEVLRCKSGETVTKSCDRSALIDQRSFVIFEVSCFAIGLLSYLISYTRNRVLSNRKQIKIERQLNRMQ